jgi:outer membrane protein assembly factor BamB
VTSCSSSARRFAALVRVAAATLLLIMVSIDVSRVAAQDPDEDDAEDRVRQDEDDDEPAPVRRDRRGRAARGQDRDQDQPTQEAPPAPGLETLLRVRLEASPAAQAAVLGRMAFVPLRNGRLVRIDLDSGRSDGSTPVEATHAPAAGDGLVFVVSAEALTAFDPSGTARWSVPVAGGFATAPLWDTGWLIASTAGGEVMGIRARDGQVLWTRHVGAPASALPAIAGDRLYVPLRDGRLVALELLTGAVAWERPLGGQVGAPFALDDRVFVGTSGKHFYCLSTSDGKGRWKFRVGGSITGAPVVDTRHVYVAALDNVLRALNRFSGSLAWEAGLPFRPLGGPLMLGDVVFVSGVGPEANGYSAADGRLALQHSGTRDLVEGVAPQSIPNARLPELSRVLVFTRPPDPELQLLQRRLEVPVEPLREMIGVPVPIAPPPER